jgi:hypothetical protein
MTARPEADRPTATAVDAPRRVAKAGAGDAPRTLRDLGQPSANLRAGKAANLPGFQAVNLPLENGAGLKRAGGRHDRARGRLRHCRECGASFRAKRPEAEFCAASCRKAFHNRRQLRGAAFFDLVMAMRFARQEAQAEGAWSLLCRLAASCRAEDQRERAGRPSWDGVAKVRARHPKLAATVVGRNVAGKRGRDG